MKDCQKKTFFQEKSFFRHKPTFHHFKTTSQFIHKFSLQMSWLIAIVWICHYEDLFTYFDLDYEVSNFGFWFRHEGAISGKWCCTRGRRGRKYYILARYYQSVLQVCQRQVAIIASCIMRVLWLEFMYIRIALGINSSIFLVYHMSYKHPSSFLLGGWGLPSAGSFSEDNGLSCDCTASEDLGDQEWISWKIHMLKQKNGGLVQMISLFKQVIFRFHVHFPECRGDDILPSCSYIGIIS